MYLLLSNKHLMQGFRQQIFSLHSGFQFPLFPQCYNVFIKINIGLLVSSPPYTVLKRCSHSFSDCEIADLEVLTCPCFCIVGQNTDLIKSHKLFRICSGHTKIIVYPCFKGDFLTQHITITLLFLYHKLPVFMDGITQAFINHSHS